MGIYEDFKHYHDPYTQYIKSLRRFDHLVDETSRAFRPPTYSGSSSLYPIFVILIFLLSYFVQVQPHPILNPILGHLAIGALATFACTSLFLLFALVFARSKNVFRPLRPTLHFVIPASLLCLLFPLALLVHNKVISVPVSSRIGEYFGTVFLLYFGFGVAFVSLHKPSRACLATFPAAYRKHRRKMRRLRRLKRALERNRLADDLKRRREEEAAERTPVLPAIIVPAHGIAIKLKRSQKNRRSVPIFMLDARLDSSKHFLACIQKYGLARQIVYDSAARRHHQEAIERHLTHSHNDTALLAPASDQAKGIAKTFWHIGRAAVSSARASLALRVTVRSLLSGVHIESPELSEILQAESEIREAAESIKSYVETAESFNGSEELIEL
jgi:hypothetical protein